MKTASHIWLPLASGCLSHLHTAPEFALGSEAGSLPSPSHLPMVPLRLFCAIWGPKVLPAPSMKTNAWLSTPLCEPPTAPLASPACLPCQGLPSGLAWGLRQHFPRIWFPPSLWPSCSGCHPTHRLCLCRDLFSNQNESGCGFFICSKEKSYRAVGLGACSGGLNWEQSRACSSVTSTAMRAKAAPGLSPRDGPE